MKKNIILGIIIALLIVAVAVEGFFLWKQNDDKKKEEGKDKTEQVEQTPSPEPSPEPVKLPEATTVEIENLTISKNYFAPKEDELVYTYMEVKVKEINEYGHSEYNYQFNIPQINLDSDYVKKLNKNILEKYEDITDKISKEKHIDFNFEGLEYKCFKNDNILSLVMHIPTESSGWFESEVYNIDITTGQEISNDELLNACGITESKLRDYLESTVYDAYKDFDGSDPNIKESFVKSQRDKTQKKYKDISINDIKLFINENSKLCAYLVVYNLAGPEEGTRWVNLEEKKSNYNLFLNVGPHFVDTNKSIFEDSSKLNYTANLKDDINGKIAVLKEGENVFKTEQKNGYYIYVDNFENKYNIKEITSINSKFEAISNNNYSALFKVTITYKDNSDKINSFDAAVIVSNNETKNVNITVPYVNYTGTTEFVKNFTDLYSE